MAEVMITQAEPPLSEASPSVQAHIGILQSVIQRMSTNSTSCKAWCISLVSAILVVIADKGKPSFALIALIPIVLFCSLDSYYLALEKGFRVSYNEFIQKLHSGNATVGDLFAVTPKGNASMHQLEALGSFPVWGFYLTLAILVEVTRLIVIK